MCGAVVLKHLFQNYILGDCSEDGFYFLDGKIMRGNWSKLHWGKLQVDEGENPLKWGWRDMEQRVATESSSSELD